jgi:hypothetical protein
MIAVLKKALTSGGRMVEGGEKVPGAVVDAPGACSAIVSDTTAKAIPVRSVNVGKPLSSLSQALPFARRFLIWCANNGIHGEIDCSRLFVFSQEFAEFCGARAVSERALSKALSQLKIRKKVRDIKAYEKGLVSHKTSKAKRPRVTVYILPKEPAAILELNQSNLDLFG